MSLLMEALKKAEEAKRLASEGVAPTTATAAAHELTLKPLEPVSTQKSTHNSPLPDLSLHIDSVDADLAAVSTEAPARRRASESTSKPPTPSSALQESAERTAVRNVFAAKQPPKSRTGLWLLLGSTALAALSIGGYFWWQWQSVSVGSLARSVQPPGVTSTVPVQPPVLTTVEAATSSPEPASTAVPFAPKATPSSALPNERPVRPQKPTANPSPTVPESPVRLSKNQPRSNQTLERAYDSLQAGHLDEAQRGYEHVLRGDVKSTDALLGLATIAALQGQTDRAQAYYLNALESDPNDATAQAGVINTRGQADAGQSESRLKTALSSQPDSAALHFALGNVYARQVRWSEAQQAYFRAYSIEPDNADFIFNLAVSLDHLHQNKLAAQYYQMALNTASSANAAFDRVQVKNRVLELLP